MGAQGILAGITGSSSTQHRTDFKYLMDFGFPR